MKFIERLDAASDGDLGPIAKWGIKWIIIFMVISVPLGMIGSALGWFNKATAVVAHEIDPQILLNKYIWFKETHSALDAKLATLKRYEKTFARLESEYTGIPRSKWPRDDREAWNQKAAEVDGIAASYNELASQYNAKMAEINWRFTNIGDLPAGATEVLPREYAPYNTGDR
jgi:hypothetical protein